MNSRSVVVQKSLVKTLGSSKQRVARICAVSSSLLPQKAEQHYLYNNLWNVFLGLIQENVQW